MSALGDKKLLENFAASDNALLIWSPAVPAQGSEILAIPDLANRQYLHAQATKPFMEDLNFEGARPRKFDKVEFMVFPTSMTYNKLLRP